MRNEKTESGGHPVNPGISPKFSTQSSYTAQSKGGKTKDFSDTKNKQAKSNYLLSPQNTKKPHPKSRHPVD